MLLRRMATDRPEAHTLLSILLAAGVSTSVSSIVTTQATADPDTRAVITDPPEQNPLPIGMTTEEEALRHTIGAGVTATQPPSGPIRQCAEWEPVTGVLVRYPFGHPYTVLREMAEEIELWVLVASVSQQNTCNTALQNNGVNMANVHYVIAATNSIWTRDYGPQFVFDGNGAPGIVDHVYNRPRPLDDQVNYTVGTSWTTQVFGSSLIHTGGNYLCDGHGNGYSTDLVWDENPSLSHAQVAQAMEDYLGITDYRVFDDVSIGGIHHLDVWGKLLDERTFLVKQVPTNHPDYARCEARAAELATRLDPYGQPLRVRRVYCDWINGSEVAAYTNSVILNRKVLVPTFGIAADAAALAKYQELMPGYEIIGFTGSWLSDDAIHCRAMGIHDKQMMYVDMAPLPDTLGTNGPFPVEVRLTDYSNLGLDQAECILYWENTTIPSSGYTELQPIGPIDMYGADIPPQPSGTVVEYYVVGQDVSGRSWVRPGGAPFGAYSAYVAGNATDVPEFTTGLVLEPLSPNPFTDGTTLRFSSVLSGGSIWIVDTAGREVMRWNSPVGAGQREIAWDGRDQRGRQVPAGVYLIRIEAGGQQRSARAVRIR
ncbi:MAG: agmatine deiminase family protein [Candidatus Eisenbacteria bacterium]|nr:agmatine deiminase family protein [Candidatus Eisenbacteria bacterium]